MKHRILIAFLFALAALVSFLLFFQKDTLKTFLPAAGDEESSPPTSLPKHQVPPTQPTAQNGNRTGGGDFFSAKISFDLIKQKAESGDSSAQRELAEMYEDCMSYSVSPEKSLKSLDYISTTHPESRNRIEKIKKQTIDFCRNVDGGQPIPAVAYQLWLERSAESGDLVAEIRQSVRGANGLDQGKLKDLSRKVMDSKNPEALYELSNILGRQEVQWETEEDSRIFGSRYSQNAMAIAACRAGMNCGPDSRLMRLVCTSTFRCNYQNYEQYVYAELTTPAERREVENIASMISSKFPH